MIQKPFARPSAAIVSSPLEEWTRFLNSLEQDLVDPITKHPSADLSVLACGCLLSDQLAESSKRCPKCGADNIATLTKLSPLRSIYEKIEQQKQKLGVDLLSGKLERLGATTEKRRQSADDDDELLASNIDFDLIQPRALHQGELGSKPGLIDLFKNAAASISKSNKGKAIATEWLHQVQSSTTTLTPSMSVGGASTSAGNSSSTASIRSPLGSPTIASMPAPVPPVSSKLPAQPLINQSGPMGVPQHGGSSHVLLPSSYLPDDEKREYNYGKCFPMFRKQFQHGTQPRTFLQRSKRATFSTCISPDASKFALVSATKFQIYAIPTDFNDAPILLSEPAVEKWGDTPMVSMSNKYVAVAGRNGLIRIYDLDAKVIFSQTHKMEIHCMALSPFGSMLAFGIYAKNPLPPSQKGDTIIEDERTSMIVLTTLQPKQADPSIFNSDTKGISIVIPYRDTINFLKFSPDEALITCATMAESRFMVISLANRREPRLVMKSSRRVDPDEEYEGITSVNFFPAASNRHHYMCVTSSVLTIAPPIILDTKITAPSSSSASIASAVSQPALLMRVDKVGSRIHGSAISPRADALAFLDKSGVVYVMHAPGLLSDQRRIAVATEVAAAPQRSSAASIQFSPSGQVLVVVDRRGDVHIQDYGAGTPQQAGVGKCRLLA